MKKLITLLFFVSHTVIGSVIIKNGLTQIHNMGKNEKQNGILILQNTGTKPEKIKIYFHDLSTSCNGDIAYNEPGSQKLSLCKYLIVGNKEIEIFPKQEYELVYRIDLESNNIEQGSLWALMMVEIVEPISKSQRSKGIEIGSKIRYAVQLIAHIGDNENPVMKITDVKLNNAATGEKSIDASILNMGLFMIMPVIEVQIFNEKGELKKEQKITPKKVYPGYCQMFQIPISELESGKYKAILLAEYQEETIGLNLNIEL
jgi:hypothetical protein